MVMELSARPTSNGLALRAVYRYCEVGTLKPRPSWFSKVHCLEGFIASARRVEARELHFVVDGEIGSEAAELMEREGRIHRLRGAGNSGTLRHAIDVALTGDDPELVVLAEDDHVWLPEAIPAMLEAVRSRPEIDYLTTYTESAKWNDPDQLAFQRNQIERIRDEAEREWRPIRSTVMTFGARPRALRADRWLFRAQSRGVHPNGWLIFAALQGVGRRRWSALHLVLSSTGTSRATRAVRMLRGEPSVRLWCSDQALSGHAEVGMLPEGLEDGFQQ